MRLLFWASWGLLSRQTLSDARIRYDNFKKIFNDPDFQQLHTKPDHAFLGKLETVESWLGRAQRNEQLKSEWQQQTETWRDPAIMRLLLILRVANCPSFAKPGKPRKPDVSPRNLLFWTTFGAFVFVFCGVLGKKKYSKLVCWHVVCLMTCSCGV